MTRLWRLPLVRAGVVCAFVIACGDPPPEGSTTGGVSSEPAADVETPPPPEVAEDVAPAAACLVEEFWYCPPLNEVWRKIVVVDVCDDRRVVSIGECVKVFECMPGPGSTVTACTTEDGKTGTRESWCDKGHLVDGPCVACEPEVCDGLDNNCDGVTDEGWYPCESLCGPGLGRCVLGVVVDCTAKPPQDEICNGIDDDCDSLTDEGTSNACGDCGETPAEVCNGFDDDCDGATDEDLVNVCSTVCGAGVAVCLQGAYQLCTAPVPEDEQCNGMDDDCDGLVDEDLLCGCAPGLIGALAPCQGPPLTCGSGYKRCECQGPECAITAWSPCHALCFWTGTLPCNPAAGEPVLETCNAWDDDCDSFLDEGLTKSCYTGPPGTEGVGLCKPGELWCDMGKWGYWVNGVLVEGMCHGEVLPATKDVCNGVDDDCDGKTDGDKKLAHADILFIVDWSGSMSDKISAVLDALQLFALSYTDHPALRWGIEFAPVGSPERLRLAADLTSFDTFLTVLAGGAGDVMGGSEMLYDAVYLSIWNLVPPAELPYAPATMTWSGPGIALDSEPPLSQFMVHWRPGVRHVVILFTDEEGQSYLKPQVTSTVLAPMLGAADALSMYTFSKASAQVWNVGGLDWGFGVLASSAQKGAWYELTSDSATMYGHLMEILDAEVCE